MDDWIDLLIDVIERRKRLNEDAESIPYDVGYFLYDDNEKLKEQEAKLLIALRDALKDERSE